MEPGYPQREISLQLRHLWLLPWKQSGAERRAKGNEGRARDWDAHCSHFSLRSLRYCREMLDGIGAGLDTPAAVARGVDQWDSQFNLLDPTLFAHLRYKLTSSWSAV